MTLVTHFIVFPEGDLQEIDSPLRINQIVDLNGRALPLPLRTVRIIAFRVYKISTEEKTGVVNKFHYLELLRGEDMTDYLA